MFSLKTVWMLSIGTVHIHVRKMLSPSDRRIGIRLLALLLKCSVIFYSYTALRVQYLSDISIVFKTNVWILLRAVTLMSPSLKFSLWHSKLWHLTNSSCIYISIIGLFAGEVRPKTHYSYCISGLLKVAKWQKFAKLRQKAWKNAVKVNSIGKRSSI